MNPEIIATTVTIAQVMLLVALFLAFLRLARGPSLPDRVVALDMISILTVSIVATYDITENEPAFLDAAIVLALISFLGTVAFAYYVERRDAK